jgi:hypothetical protein
MRHFMSPRALLGSLALALLIGSGPIASGFSQPAAAAGRASTSTLPKGTLKVNVTWKSKKSGAAFSGKIGRLSIEGVSVQPQPYKTDFVVSGRLGSQAFRVDISTKSVSTTGITFTVTGKVGRSVLDGTAMESLDLASGSGKLTLHGTLGKTTLSGTIPLSGGRLNGVRGTLTVG